MPIVSLFCEVGDFFLRMKNISQHANSRKTLGFQGHLVLDFSCVFFTNVNI